MSNVPIMMMTQEAPVVPPTSARASAATAMADINELELLLEGFLVSIIAMAGAKAGAVRVLTDDGQRMRLVSHLGLPDHVGGG
jgi:two-component system nitrate/nitrite sensor histidine kinase NarX